MMWSRILAKKHNTMQATNVLTHDGIDLLTCMS